MGEGDNGMIKSCVVLKGKIINIGEWDYQYTKVNDEQIALNPMPEGAVIEERDFEHDEDRGWYEVGTYPEPTAQERIEALEAALLEVVLGG